MTLLCCLLAAVAQEGFRTPEGFKAAVWAEGLRGPASISVDDRGRAFVVEGGSIRLFEDRDGDGRAEEGVVFADGFDSPGGLLARRGEVWLGAVPNLWRCRDRDGDGKAEDRKAVFTGFGTRPAGHGLGAIAAGPDGRLYLAMGDRGLVVRNSEGERLEYAEMGAVLRCDPDGGNLEVFAIGLRDPRDLAFDAHGNLFALDGAGWSGVVEGSDGGWRSGFAEAPESGGASRWVAEEIGKGKAAYALAPIAVLDATRAAGVSRLCGPWGIRALEARPKGAAFEIEAPKPFAEGPAVADADLGPDGALYALAAGKIWRIAGPAATDGAKILAGRLADRSLDELSGLLGHAEPRVRAAAQLELVGRQGSTQALIAVSRRSDAPPLARLHAVWGLGQLYTRNPLFPLLRDKDPEVRAQAARVLGDRRVGDALDDLVRALKDESPRVRLFAALALGRIGRREGGKPVLEMLRANDDADPWLRHAGVFALASINDGQALHEAAKDGSKALRRAVLVAMRRCGRPGVSSFLEDREPELVVEAARAIHDLPIPAALPRLAELLEGLPGPAMLRSINANYRLGTAEAAQRLAKFAARPDAPEAMRVEAIRALGAWGRPGDRDRVLGLRRPLEARDPAPALEALKSVRALLDADPSEAVRKASGDVPSR
jgi:HEAT repeat protein